jgi:hypothetical protein
MVSTPSLIFLNMLVFLMV